MMIIPHTTAGRIRFSPGALVTTPSALAALLIAGTTLAEYLTRHLRGDTGDLDVEDRALNVRAMRRGDGRVLSAYTLPTGTRIWLITTLLAGQGCETTILLPEEY
jgi:hypothetical protein